MKTEYDFINRMAVIAKLAKEDTSLGRTKLMKYLYILQTVKSVPLGYRFQLYVYGPYDAMVISDLVTAEVWEAVKEELIPYSDGYGYQIRPGDQNKKLLDSAKEFLGKHQKAIEWVVKNFSSFTAAKLELIGTIVWADQEAKRSGTSRTEEELIKLVLEIKPRFLRSEAEEIVKHLKRLKVLQAIT
jgi:uncharacterized protein YwgA